MICVFDSKTQITKTSEQALGTACVVFPRQITKTSKHIALGTMCCVSFVCLLLFRFLFACSQCSLFTFCFVRCVFESKVHIAKAGNQKTLGTPCFVFPLYFCFSVRICSFVLRTQMNKQQVNNMHWGTPCFVFPFAFLFLCSVLSVCSQCSLLTCFV